MTNIIMFDTAENSQFPASPQATAAYVDGGIGDQPNYQWTVANFPKAYHLSIALDPAHDADALDVEPGAATPSSAAAWYARQLARGITRPCIYASASTMESDILPVIKAAGFPRAKVRLWSAHYGQGEHICGPHSCGLMSVDADGTQWISTAMGRNLDQSLLHPDFFTPPWPVFQGDSGPHVITLQQRINAWKVTNVPLTVDGQYGAKTGLAVEDAARLFGVPVSLTVHQQLWELLMAPPPAAPVYGPPTGLKARGGHTTVFLEWRPPGTEGLPDPPQYLVSVFDDATGKIVDSYPRIVTTTSFQGGSLEQGKSYIAHVVSSGIHGTLVKPHTYASVKFETA